jgi:hypothetical protein
MSLTAKFVKMLNEMNTTTKKVGLGTVIKALQVATDGGTAGTPDARLDAIQAENALFRKAMSGDIAFKCTPATLNKAIASQNVGVAQAMIYTIGGAVAEAGAGNINVTVTAAGLTGGAKTVSVAVANSDDAAAIATAIKTALEADAAIAHATTGMFTIAINSAELTFTKKTEAANDATMAFAVVTDTATFAEGSDLSATAGAKTAGVVPYTRSVLVELVTAADEKHTWFNGVVPITIAETTAGSGVASIATTSPSMVNGAMTITVTCQGVWAAADINTLTISQATICGATVAAKTSVETSA